MTITGTTQRATEQAANRTHVAIPERPTGMMTTTAAAAEMTTSGNTEELTSGKRPRLTGTGNGRPTSTTKEDSASQQAPATAPPP